MGLEKLNEETKTIFIQIFISLSRIYFASWKFGMNAKVKRVWPPIKITFHTE